MKLAELAWPEVEHLDRDIIVIYPIAALEQHSRHLPFFTDSILCDGVASRLEAALPNEILLLPVQWLGASAHHLGMPGSLTAQSDTYLNILCEPLRCLLQHGFRRVFILNGHGGNIDGFHLALRQLALEFPDSVLAGASYWDLADKEIAAILQGERKNVGHACEFETSMMMYLRPELVRTSEIADDKVKNTSEALKGIYIPLDFKRHTRHGGSGQATLATAAKGKQFMDAIVPKSVEIIKAIKARPIV
ncbi:creatininase family protein [Pedosphaera parvula]|nr:creatininase family protein [Pedosphaera parvula]